MKLSMIQTFQNPVFVVGGDVNIIEHQVTQLVFKICASFTKYIIKKQW